ncbi:hypothetical protein K439DRAFT_1636547 [Ramaria rubella]|nr:hypothetical protein K439DRAFT_1636547 [Ramaria rubella]
MDRFHRFHASIKSWIPNPELAVLPSNLKQIPQASMALQASAHPLVSYSTSSRLLLPLIAPRNRRTRRTRHHLTFPIAHSCMHMHFTSSPDRPSPRARNRAQRNSILVNERLSSSSASTGVRSVLLRRAEEVGTKLEAEFASLMGVCKRHTCDWDRDS